METPVLGPNTTQSGDDNDRLWKNPVLGPLTPPRVVTTMTDYGNPGIRS